MNSAGVSRGKLTKIDAMHRKFGRMESNVCENCCNLKRFDYRGKAYMKCAAYGFSQSEATDWSGKNIACGLFGLDFYDMGLRPLFTTAKSKKSIDGNQPLLGQISFDFDHNTVGACR